MDRSSQIIRTSVVGIVANVLLAHGFYYSEKDRMVSVDVVPDITVRDDAALVCQLTEEIQALAPGLQVVVVIDHNYSE